MATNLLRRTQHQEDENKYAKYGFTQNPFPIDPTVKPFSEDRRENGSIFLEDLRTEELEEFNQRIINSRTKIGFLMDYAAYRGRGIGKTAFMNYVKNEINRDLGNDISGGTEVLYAIYVSPSPEKRERTMSLIARNIYTSMLNSDLLQIVFSRLRAFSGEVSEDILMQIDSPSLYLDTICNDSWLFERGVNVNKLNDFVNQKLLDIGIQITPEARTLFSANDSHKSYNDFYEYFSLFAMREYAWKREGCKMVFDTLVRLLKTADITHCIILLDEVEKIVTYQNFAEKRAFCDSLRNYFIDGPSINAISAYYKLFMTIHPNSQELLMPHWQAAGLERFSDLGGNTAKDNTVFFRPIQSTGDMTRKLTLIYMNNARDDRDININSVSPFTERALDAIMLKAQMVPGRFLKYMYNAVEKGIENEWDVIDLPQVETMWSSSNESDSLFGETMTLPETKTVL